jgi:hypothetical protein
MADTMSSATLRRLPAVTSAPRALGELLRGTQGRREDPQFQVALGPSRAWSFDVRQDPIEIALLEGEVMVTFEGDPEDHILAAGAAFRTPRRGKVAVAAFRPSRFSVAAA